jgi:hypothetical protein
MMQPEKPTAHTPGPWKVSPADKDRGALHVYGSYGRDWIEVAKVQAVTEWAGSETANARLIAAAPELAEALLEFVDWKGAKVTRETAAVLFEKARAALQKAGVL